MDENIQLWAKLVESGQLDIDEAEKDIGGEKYEMSGEMPGKKLWIDDIRPAPEGFHWVKSTNEAKQYILKTGLKNIVLIDTDHDAGDFQKDGGDYVKVFDWLDEVGAFNLTIHIHSANPVGANNIRSIISRNKENGWTEVKNS